MEYAHDKSCIDHITSVESALYIYPYPSGLLFTKKTPCYVGISIIRDGHQIMLSI